MYFEAKTRSFFKIFMQLEFFEFNLKLIIVETYSFTTESY